MVTGRPQLHLGAALDGAGRHPAAWRVSSADPAALFTSAHYLAHARLAESALLDFVTLDDSLAIQPGDEGVVRGRLDPLLTFAAIAPLTRSIGLMPTVTTTHTEPFHVSTAVATLDYASRGRAGVLAVPSVTEAETRHFGRRPAPGEAAAQAENAEVTDVIARLWDSWEDGAIIRDEATGRFIDRAKLHYVDFAGRFFAVKGPSITPRPPQGHPVIAVYGDSPHAVPAEVVLTEAADPAAIRRVADRAPGAKVFATVSVLLADTEREALARKEELDELHGEAVRPDGLEYTGDPAGLAEALPAWAEAAGVDGFLVRPAVLPEDLRRFAEDVVPRLRRAGAFRDAYPAATLRENLGLPVAVNQYAGASR
ncbi:LLM class flavin-dependent oxidoreductase [Amycolatopsis anabasis]|uniref:LLM class flavin-dependent oxidoreductase n=1 Tax=Amycolatopsis anabasis TaxID=1840409 RepID=UPI00131BE88E|nr:LLM class flavin-dependent oxidoreductase [Amycolatopsis anabasis]